jgi:hypothetical protein
MSLQFSRRKIDGYKVPSKYTTDFLQVIADFKSLNIPVLVCYVGLCLGIKTGTGSKDPTPLVLRLRQYQPSVKRKKPRYTL